MKNRGLFIGIVLLFMGVALSCNAQSTVQNEENQSLSSDNVEVYYFHYSRRCATCQAVEEESEKALKELYPEQVESGTMTFLSIDIEEESNNALAEKFNISGQTLLVVKGEKQKNLTNTAFMHARSNPDKLKKEMGKAIASL